MIEAIRTGLWAALYAELPRKYQLGLDDAGGLVGDFNDAPETTHADVMALFDRAIAAAPDDEVA